MTHEKDLIEQHVHEYESRLKHIDELLARAGAGVTTEVEDAEYREQLERLHDEKAKLQARYEELRLKRLEDWQTTVIDKSGPMGLWDALAQQAERLVERIEKKR